MVGVDTSGLQGGLLAQVWVLHLRVSGC